ncbi:MAG: hypothetical protein A2Y57_04735 [Candidatus Woykebacteria bacterium RBG_13_40_7b]|uniref:Uncharacterized protein n=1 Tax=Candidatus Woykebacteria bacterium RBG_13_40_7b TaxID=1802594 RepID=A0A1G1W856_9BACT|nr:MAG: hypothetical protein A2Y57_04735 [Candidatus Woykebacteria bacterium RBG_13_40_7b]
MRRFLGNLLFNLVGGVVWTALIAGLFVSASWIGANCLWSDSSTTIEETSDFPCEEYEEKLQMNDQIKVLEVNYNGDEVIILNKTTGEVISGFDPTNATGYGLKIVIAENQEDLSDTVHQLNVSSPTEGFEGVVGMFICGTQSGLRWDNLLIITKEPVLPPAPICEPEFL